MPLLHGHTFGPIERDADGNPIARLVARDAEAITERSMMRKPCPGAASRGRRTGNWFNPVSRLFNWAAPEPEHARHEVIVETKVEALTDDVDKTDFDKIFEQIVKEVEGSEERFNVLPIFGETGESRQPQDDRPTDVNVKWFAPGGRKGWKPEYWIKTGDGKEIHHRPHQGDHDHDHDHKHKHKDHHHDHKHTAEEYRLKEDHKHHDHHGHKHHGHKHHGHKHHKGIKGAYKSTKHSLKDFGYKVANALEELSPCARFVITTATLLSSFLVGVGLGRLIRLLFMRKSREQRRAARKQRKEARKAAKAAYKAGKATKTSKAVEAGYTDAEEALPSYGEAETDALVERQ